MLKNLEVSLSYFEYHINAFLMIFKYMYLESLIEK